MIRRPAIASQCTDRTMQILDHLAANPGLQTLTSICRSVGLNDSTTHRILNDLAAGGFVYSPPGYKGLYRLSEQWAKTTR